MTFLTPCLCSLRSHVLNRRHKHWLNFRPCRNYTSWSSWPSDSVWWSFRGCHTVTNSHPPGDCHQKRQAQASPVSSANYKFHRICQVNLHPGEIGKRKWRITMTKRNGPSTPWERTLGESILGPVSQNNGFPAFHGQKTSKLMVLRKFDSLPALKVIL